jgi:hypothetical protein
VLCAPRAETAPTIDRWEAGDYGATTRVSIYLAAAILEAVRGGSMANRQDGLGMKWLVGSRLVRGPVRARSDRDRTLWCGLRMSWLGVRDDFRTWFVQNTA